MQVKRREGVGALLMVEGADRAEAGAQMKETAEELGLSANEQGAGLIDAAAVLGFRSDETLAASVLRG